MRLMQRGALFLEALAQPVQAQHALLLAGLDRHEAHARPRRRLADRRRVVGVVLAALAFHAVRRDEVRRNQPRIQPQRAQLARPVVRARAGLHRHQAARGQLRAPGEELLALERACHHAPARCIHRVDLDHLLGQVNAYPHDRRSCNLAHGTSPFQFQIDDSHTQSWCFDTVTGRWEVPSYSRYTNRIRGGAGQGEQASDCEALVAKGQAT